jgi:hypothetical protein
MLMHVDFVLTRMGVGVHYLLLVVREPDKMVATLQLKTLN